MTIELFGSMLFFGLTVFALIFSLTKSSHVDIESFPNRGRFFIGLILWILSSILAIFMSFPGYSAWFMPAVYPVMKVAFSLTFLVGFFMVLTTVNAFPLYMDSLRQEINGRSDRIVLLENIRRIASQPYPITELFTLTLKELSSFLILKKGAVFLFNPSKREMYLVAQMGLTTDEISRMERFVIGQDIISRAATEQMPFISGDLAASDSATRKLILAGRDITLSAAAMPLSARDRSLGAMLVLSDKPYRFEKQERLVLSSAAEAIAAEVESNRMVRENQKLAGQFEDASTRLSRLIADVKNFAAERDSQAVLTSACKALVDRHGVSAGRIVELSRGELQERARFEVSPDLSEKNESYRIAVIDAIRRQKMVVLNQEAKSKEGSIFINRSTLLCPFSVRGQGDFALLVEAPGNGLPLSEPFIHEVEVWVSLIGASLNMARLKNADALSQSAVKSLLNILKIKHNSASTTIYRQFIEEAARVLPASAAILVYAPDFKNGYRILDGCNVPDDALHAFTFLPGEGPVGKTAVSATVTEFTTLPEVDSAWRDLETANQDFFGRLFGERGIPNYQLNIPIIILEEVVAVVSVFDHRQLSAHSRREKGLLLLAAQLLSIKLSMARMDEQMFENLADEKWHNAGNILNRLNNDLATVIGRAQLLERQSDISGRTRYTAGEILRASENAAELIQKLQEGIEPPSTAPAPRESLSPIVDRILEKRRVTGNLYMFENNKPVTLQTQLTDESPSGLKSDLLVPIIDLALAEFVTLAEENQEVFIKSELKDGYFFVSLVRGTTEDFKGFEATTKDFGDPDVLPRDFITDTMIKALNEGEGQVSFDRFGRRPTYLSFRFPEAATTIGPLLPPRLVSGESLRILAIDDQQMILDLLSGICQSLGIELTAVQSPRDGISLFQRESFDIVMVDLVMDELSGWDVARAVKSHSPETPIIMMTGWGMALTGDEIRRAGIDYTLAKPFKIEQLTAVIAKARRKRVKP